MTMSSRSSLLGLVFLLPLLGAQKPYQQSFPPDLAPPAGFRANRSSYSAVMDVL